MKVISLFDGISCARVALERVGIKVDAYYASEIDKYVMQISQKNYPEIIQLGSVTDIDVSEFDGCGWETCTCWNQEEHLERNLPFDLLIGGSPCQDLSIAKKERKGLDGDRSSLFWEYVRILKEVRPKYFIFENVNSMPKEAKALITETLGVEPIMIDAGIVSAQQRKRLFWTNIPGVTLPKDKEIQNKPSWQEQLGDVVVRWEKYNESDDTSEKPILLKDSGFYFEIEHIITQTLAEQKEEIRKKIEDMEHQTFLDKRSEVARFIKQDELLAKIDKF